MSIEPKIHMPDVRRRELALALEGMSALVEEARQNLLDGDEELALTPLDLIRKGLLPVRNSIGQWHDRVICPGCGQEGRNIVAVRQGESEGTDVWPTPHHYADIGFRCQHCGLEWGFQVRPK